MSLGTAASIKNKCVFGSFLKCSWLYKLQFTDKRLNIKLTYITT